MSSTYQHPPQHLSSGNNHHGEHHTMTSTLALAPLTADGLDTEREEAWYDLAAWAKTLAHALESEADVSYIHESIIAASRRHQIARDAARARR